MDSGELFKQRCLCVCLLCWSLAHGSQAFCNLSCYLSRCMDTHTCTYVLLLFIFCAESYIHKNILLINIPETKLTVYSELLTLRGMRKKERSEKKKSEKLVRKVCFVFFLKDNTDFQI